MNNIDVDEYLQLVFNFQNEYIDRCFLYLETHNLNWNKVDPTIRLHPIRNIKTMLENIGECCLTDEDKEKLMTKILSYGNEIVDREIITQEQLQKILLEHDKKLKDLESNNKENTGD